MSFTGSTAVFRDLWKKIGSNIDRYRSYPRIVGETGGKNAVVAHPSADPRGAARGAGPRRLRVPGPEVLGRVPRLPPAQPVEGAWRAGWPTPSAQLEVGDSTRHETFLGAVIDEARAAPPGIDHRRGQGAARPPHPRRRHGATRAGWFVEPTIIVAEDPDSFLMQKEFFGPLLAVHVYDDADWDKVLQQVDTHQRVRPDLLDLRQRPRRRSAPRSTRCATPPA